MAGVPNVCYKNNTHILGISIHFFPKNVAVGLNGRILIIVIKEI